MTWQMMIPFSGRSLIPTDDPFAAMRREMNRAFDGILNEFPERVAATTLKLDVKEDEKAFHVTAELAGLSEKEVEVTFQDGLLTIRGEKKVERDEKKDTWHIVERSSGSFSRQLKLPTNVNADGIEAKFDKGVLTVTLPKLADERAQAKRIEVKTG